MTETAAFSVSSTLGTRIQLLAFDLDGTLLSSNGAISERTRRALADAEAAHVAVMSVTARPPRRVRLIAESTGLTGLAICSNGGLLYDIIGHRALNQVMIEPEAGTALVQLLRAEVPGVRFAAELGMRYGCEADYEIATEHATDVNDKAMLREDALTLCQLGATKLIIQHPGHSLADLLNVVNRHAGDQVTVTHSGSNFVEVGGKGVTKASALEHYCTSRGIAPEAVIAFGDMPNDLPMLRWAGRGVAVANAHPDLLEAADEITASNDDDGVAVVLERLAMDQYVLR